MSREPDSAANEAEGVLTRWYRDWINDQVQYIAREIFDGEIDDREALIERMEALANQSIETTGTHDHLRIVLVGARDEGRSEWEDYRDPEEAPDEPSISSWAYFTFLHDLREALETVGLDLNDFDRDEWIKSGMGGNADLNILWDQHLVRGGRGLDGEKEDDGDEDEYAFDPLDPDDRPSYRDLRRRPTISQSQNDDLKYDDGAYRFWVTREPGARTVTIELLERGRWITAETYEG